MKKLLRDPFLGLCALTVVSAGLQAQTLLYDVGGSASDDHFGTAVVGLGDVNGDGRADWAVGAPQDANVFNLGPGYVRVFSGATGTALFTLQGSALSTDAFGSALGTVGDLNGDGRPEFIVGAPGAGANFEGRAYVYPAMGGAPLFTVAGSNLDDQIGLAVAGCGDVNNDGKPDFVVGAPLADVGGTERGYARVYSGLNGALLWTFTGTTNNEHLGLSVDGAGDVNGDGKADVLVGSSTGGAKIYSGATGLVLRTFSAPVLDRLGVGVAGLTDVNGDGVRDVAIGAPQDGSLFSPGPGYVNVYSGATGALIYTLNGLAAGDRFGISVADARDLTGDGRSEILVGADQYAFGGTGYAKVYNGATSALLYTLNGVSASDRVGAALDGMGDANLDGRLEFVLGIPNRSNLQSLAGEAQVWSQPAGCPQPNTYCTAANNSTGGPALMAWSGSTSIAANNLVLQTSGAPANKLALYAYSATQANTPAGNGILCIGAPFIRLPAFATSSGGTASYGLDYNSLPGAGQIHAGDVRNFVLWFRDPAAGGANFNFSNGLSVTFCP